MVTGALDRQTERADPEVPTVDKAPAKTGPLVSVIIPAYNAEKTIRRALESVLLQNYAPIEIIVVNDASHDGTAAVVESFGEPTIALINRPVNGGVSAATNTGLRRARGEYVAFLDADDEWLPGKLHKQVALISAYPQMTFVSCGGRFISSSGDVREEFGMKIPALSSDLWRKLLADTYVAKPCVLARRTAFAQVGEFDENLPMAEDQDMWIRLASAGDVGVVLEPLVHVHDTPNSLTKTHALRIADWVMPVVERNLERLRSQLGENDVKRILRERFGALGRNLYASGAYGAGIRLLSRASLLGHRPIENLWYVITASPAMKAVKARLRRIQGA
jgi:glycosyltransferase involved in cell wall biosynthesis